MFNAYTHQYALSKTLRFELIPVDGQGKKLNDLSRFTKVINDDKQRATDYQTIKPLIDECHKKLIEESLSNSPIEANQFSEYAQQYFTHKSQTTLTAEDKSNKDKQRKTMDELETQFRKKIVSALTSHKNHKQLFGKELFQKTGALQTTFPEHQATIAKFEKFTTYFTGFFENRKNLYAETKDNTAIANRLITDNLPKFLDNISKLKIIASKYPELETQLNTIEPSNQYKAAHPHPINQPEAFTQVLTQKGIDDYNQLLGGYTTQTSKVQGINEIINLFRQKNGLKKNQCPNLTPLYKQMLFDRDGNSFVLAPLQNVADVFKQIHTLINELFSNDALTERENIVNELNDSQDQLGIADKHLNSISAQLFGGSHWSFLSRSMGFIEQTESDDDTKTKSSKTTKRDTKAIYSLTTLNEHIKKYEYDAGTEEFNLIRANWLEALRKLIQDSNDEAKTAVNKFQQKYPEETSQSVEQERLKEVQKDDIKTLMDALLSLAQAYKTISSADESPEALAAQTWQEQILSLSNIISLYNKVRNFSTQKPYDSRKINLTFGKPNLLNGFVESKTQKSDNGTQYGAYLFRKHRADKSGYNYFLGISSDAKLFREHNQPSPEDFSDFERLNYYQAKMDSVFGASYDGNYQHDKLTLDESNVIQKLCVSLSKQKLPALKALSTQSFNSINNLRREIEIACKHRSINFQPISKQELTLALTAVKPLFLFQIYTKDFSEDKRKAGTDNLHTIYFKHLFKTGQSIIDLGSGQIFFRASSIPRKVTHKKNDVLNRKNPDNSGTNQFAYDLIKDKRFSEDKFQLHLSISLNYQSPNYDKSITKKVNEKANLSLHNSEAKSTHIIGIDRGERHLLYYTVINAHTGHIVEQSSLNTITKDGEVIHQTTDYHKKLDTLERLRDKNRKNWGTIENIKELKAGYLSHVVHKIATLMVEYNAFVVLEDLNFGFKRGRFHVEKQVYQKFEKALIDKLNYLVFKNTPADQLGGVLNAYQLTAPFTAFKDLGKQTGFLYYVPAHHTSKIDPWTGYVDWIKPRYESVEKAKQLISSFDSITYNQKQDYFEFKMDVNKFKAHAHIPEGLEKTEWTLCTHNPERWRATRDKATQEWNYKCIDVTTELKTLLLPISGADYGAGQNLIDRIIERSDKGFYSSFLWAMNTFMSLRFTKKEPGQPEIDYILSPVANAQGQFFDSRDYATQSSKAPYPIDADANGSSKAPYPIDADANGAYHIAKKGQMLYQRIQSSPDVTKHKDLLVLKNIEWFNYMQNQ